MKQPSRPITFRSLFAYEIYKLMKRNKKIWVVTGDFGYGMWDKVRDGYPNRYINTGAAEHTMLGVAVGLALEGCIPVVYTATTFLLYRSFETIRNYVDHESIPVKLVGSGRDMDYAEDGISHWAKEDKKVMKLFPNIEMYRPDKIEEIVPLVRKMIHSSKPWYINLKRGL